MYDTIHADNCVTILILKSIFKALINYNKERQTNNLTQLYRLNKADDETEN